MTLNESDAQKQLELTRNFLELSRNADTCAALRSSDCIQLLVQILHANDDGAGGSGGGGAARKNASQALHNIVNGNQREMKVLKLLDQIHDYSCNFLRTQLQSGGESIADDEERHPLTAMKLLMKASFDEEHRQTMCELGALKAIPNLVHLDHAVHGPASGREQCNMLRRYALMTLTNLTCGEENNKSLLCGQKQFMEALVAQLDANSNDLDDLLQATASVLRNLSWRADKHLKTIFNELGTVTSLALASMKNNKSENTLKAILSALWNLSAHCSTNKAEFCAVDGALAFLVQMLSYEGPSKTLKIVENAGGILRNVSSHIAVCESYRQILRQHNCLAILLQQLKSENQTVVSNSCGTLWNLSARCPEDQQFLIDHNAIPLLRALIGSKNTMIAEGSASALKNLVNYRAALELTPRNELPAKEANNGHAGTLPRRYSSMRLSSNPTGSLKKCSNGNTASNTLPRKCESRESIYSGKSDSDSTKYSTKSDSAFEQRKLSTAMTKSHYETPAEEQPIDYSMKYSYSEHKPPKASFDNSIDLDQPTDFSARYKERRSAQAAQPQATTTTEARGSSEILLILDETGTDTGTSSPAAQPLAKSASACDLSSDRVQRPKTLNLRSTALENLAADKSNDCLDNPEPEPGERPINYCEEGTPGCFSRFDSLNSLTDVAPGKPEKQQTVVSKTPTAEPNPAVNGSTNDNGNGNNKNQAIYSAMQTPLMFSRHSSMDSLVNDDETIACDDNASVISDYSRMQSGVISPSELPDSPTQSMPQSPRRERKIHPQQQQDQMHQTPMGNSHANDLNGNDDPLTSYCTEDTPALLSKAGSNSNLSVLSIASTANDYNGNGQMPGTLPQEVNLTEDPITKMRCGGLPTYLPVTDEMNKYYVEDSPCNFSVISELSNLTVGSTQVGPMRVVSMKPPQLLPRNAESAPKLPPRRSAVQVETEPRLLPKRSDSLSSLSMDSDDDCNLLSQAIAAGSCRPPPSGASTSSSQTKTLPKPNGHRRQTIDGAKTDYSSDDSLDDGQSKSLFEQCILSGMHKSNDTLESERNDPPSSDRFVSNQVRQIESMLATVRPPSAARSSSGSRQQHHQQRQQHHHWV
ncbi:hypothetical protein ACLKA7_011224 [Drosophila subpalustris]